MWSPTRAPALASYGNLGHSFASLSLRAHVKNTMPVTLFSEKCCEDVMRWDDTGKLQTGSSKVLVIIFIVILAIAAANSWQSGRNVLGSEVEGEDDEESSSRNGMWS